MAISRRANQLEAMLDITKGRKNIFVLLWQLIKSIAIKLNICLPPNNNDENHRSLKVSEKKRCFLNKSRNTAKDLIGISDSIDEWISATMSN